MTSGVAHASPPRCWCSRPATPASCARCASSSQPWQSRCASAVAEFTVKGRRRDRPQLRRERAAQGAHAARGLRLAGNRRRFRARGGRAAAAHPASIRLGTRAPRPAMTHNNASCCASCRPCRSASATARYCCAMVFLRSPSDPAPLIVAGAWEGRIARSPPVSGASATTRSSSSKPRSLTAGGAASADRKNQLSHRGQALRQLLATALAKQRSVIDPHHVPLALYVHLPWCVRKCPYCDFNSHAVPARRVYPSRRTSHALARRPRASPPRSAADTRARVGVLRRRHAEPVLAELDRARCLTRARATAAVSQRTWRSRWKRIQAPSSAARFADYRGRGRQPRLARRAELRRARKLALLGRIHSVGETDEAVRGAARSGARQFQPRPDVRAARADRSTERSPTSTRPSRSSPAHISHYQLTLEPGHRLRSVRPPPAGRRHELRDAGGLPGAPCRGRLRAIRGLGLRARWARCEHNLIYWQFGDYLGIGAGAHGKLTRPTAAQ